MKGDHCIVKLLQSSASYNTFVGGTEALARVQINNVPQGKPYPMCVVSVQSFEASGATKTATTGFDEEVVQVLHMAETAKAAADMATVARTVLDYPTPGTYNAIELVSSMLIDRDTFTEQLVDKLIHVEEQLYKVITR